MQYTETTEKLSTKDIKVLKKSFNKIKGGIIFFMIFSLICGFLAYLMSETYTVLIVISIIIILPLSIFLFIFINFSNSDLKSGLKNVIIGNITDKTIETKTTKDIENSDTNVYSFFYFFLGLKKILVTKEIFEKFETNDLIEVHLSVSGQIIEILEKNENNINVQEINESHIEQMSLEEINILKQVSKKIINRIIRNSFVFGFIIYWIILGSSVAIFALLQLSSGDNIVDFEKWFLILMIISFIWLLNKKTIVPLILDLKKQMKIVEKQTITDKISGNAEQTGKFISIKSQNGYFYIKNNENIYPVSENDFNKFESGMNILVNRSLQSKIFLKINEIQ